MTYPFTYDREFWEEEGWRVRQHTNSGPVDWSRVRRVVIHYTGCNDNPDGDHDELPYVPNVVQRIQRTQRDYAANRGYSIGYNVVVSQDGNSFEARGADYVCAANVNVNTTSVAVLVLVDHQDSARPEAIEMIRQIVRWAEDRAGRTLEVVGHKDVGNTACPGYGLYEQVKAGVFKEDPHMIELIPASARRVYDSRDVGRHRAGQTRTVRVGYPGQELNISVTGVSPASNGHVTIWSTGARPVSSTLNLDTDVYATSGTTWVKPDSGGNVKVFTHSECDIIIEVLAAQR